MGTNKTGKHNHRTSYHVDMEKDKIMFLNITIRYKLKRSNLQFEIVWNLLESEATTIWDQMFKASLALIPD